jgi:hypothetical protein
MKPVALVFTAPLATASGRLVLSGAEIDPETRLRFHLSDGSCVEGDAEGTVESVRHAFFFFLQLDVFLFFFFFFFLFLFFVFFLSSFLPS